MRRTSRSALRSSLSSLSPSSQTRIRDSPRRRISRPRDTSRAPAYGPASGETRATFVPSREFKRLDFPTFERPRTARAGTGVALRALARSISGKDETHLRSRGERTSNRSRTGDRHAGTAGTAKVVMGEVEIPWEGTRRIDFFLRRKMRAEAAPRPHLIRIQDCAGRMCLSTNGKNRKNQHPDR